MKFVETLKNNRELKRNKALITKNIYDELKEELDTILEERLIQNSNSEVVFKVRQEEIKYLIDLLVGDNYDEIYDYIQTDKENEFIFRLKEISI